MHGCQPCLQLSFAGVVARVWQLASSPSQLDIASISKGTPSMRNLKPTTALASLDCLASPVVSLCQAAHI